MCVDSARASKANMMLNVHRNHKAEKAGEGGMGLGGGGRGRVYTCRYTVTTRVPGEIKRSRDLRGRRWSWTLNLAQKRS